MKTVFKLKDLVKYDTSLINTNTNIEILLNKLIKLYQEQLIILNNYKKSQYYLDNKNKYTVTMKEIIHKRENVDFKFYKYGIKISFEIKDKRLINILDNLLIPTDEFDKLKKNYTGNEGCGLL